ncbi:MAG: aspartyl protease family protein [Gemmataceae bacterium]
MRFPYKNISLPSPAIALGGRWTRPRPILHVTIVGPTGSRLQEGLLDTGADDTVFPQSLAVFLGVDLTDAPVGQAASANLTKASLRYAQVSLRITDGVERREWRAWVAFSPTIPRPLLGFAGFLQFFTATFHGDREQVELTVNSLYPGT